MIIFNTLTRRQGNVFYPSDISFTCFVLRIFLARGKLNSLCVVLHHLLAALQFKFPRVEKTCGPDWI